MYFFKAFDYTNTKLFLYNYENFSRNIDFQRARSQGFKPLFMLNSTKHEINHMPTDVCNLLFISMINTIF